MTGAGDVSDKLRFVTETQIVDAFRRALVAIYPMLHELDCMSDDTQLYDPFDDVATALWNELVVGSLQWKYGLRHPPRLPAYGFVGVGRGNDGFMQVHLADGRTLQFVGFIGDRSFGSEVFNAVVVESTDGIVLHVPVAAVETFEWERESVDAVPNPTFQRTATRPLN